MKARELFQLAESHGWSLDRIRGSHHVYKKNGRHVSIPGPANREVKPGTAASIIKQIEAV